MARLVLVRHAKAEVGAPGQADIDRDLAERGLRDAAVAATTLAAIDLPGPVVALVSPAVRTQRTYDAIAAGLPRHTRIDAPELYDAAVSTVLALVGRAQAATCVVIGHNPTMRDVAAHLTGECIERFPTSAIAVLDGPSWADLASGRWRLAMLDVPRG